MIADLYGCTNLSSQLHERNRRAANGTRNQNVTGFSLDDSERVGNV